MAERRKSSPNRDEVSAGGDKTAQSPEEAEAKVEKTSGHTTRSESSSVDGRSPDRPRDSLRSKLLALADEGADDVEAGERPGGKFSTSLSLYKGQINYRRMTF